MNVGYTLGKEKSSLIQQAELCLPLISWLTLKGQLFMAGIRWICYELWIIVSFPVGFFFYSTRVSIHVHRKDSWYTSSFIVSCQEGSLPLNWDPSRNVQFNGDSLYSNLKRKTSAPASSRETHVCAAAECWESQEMTIRGNMVVLLKMLPS